MQTTLENRKKTIANSPRNAFKRKNKVEEGGALGLRVMREHESTNMKALKMMRGRVEPFAVLTMVRVGSTMVQATKQATKIPQMTIPRETQLREQRQEVPQMTSP